MGQAAPPKFTDSAAATYVAGLKPDEYAQFGPTVWVGWAVLFAKAIAERPQLDRDALKKFYSEWTSHEDGDDEEFADALLAAFPGLDIPAAQTDREQRAVEALRAADQMLDMISGAVSKASCETQDCESEPWERLVHGYWFDGMMASYQGQFREALAAYSAAPDAGQKVAP